MCAQRQRKLGLRVAVLDADEHAVHALLEPHLAEAFIHTPRFVLFAAGPDELVLDPQFGEIIAADGEPHIAFPLGAQLGVAVVDDVFEIARLERARATVPHPVRQWIEIVKRRRHARGVRG